MRRQRSTEHETQSVILDWLKVKRIFHWRSNTGAFVGTYKGKSRFVRFGKKGSPDIFVMIPGRGTFGIEVKASEGFQSQVQREFEVEFVRAGGCYILAFDLDDVIRVLEAA